MMIPAEIRDKIQECKEEGISCIDLQKRYDDGEFRSQSAKKDAIAIATRIEEKLKNGEYSKVMANYNYYYMPHSDEQKERERLLVCFKNLMCFFETVTPNWAANHNKIESQKTNNMKSSIDESKYTIDKIIQDAERMPNGLYGNIKPEHLRNIRVSALTMFYANKIAHQSKVLREKYISQVVNYEILGNGVLDNAIKNGKFGEISNIIKYYYFNRILYDDEKLNNASSDVLKLKSAEINKCKEELSKYGISPTSDIYKKKTLLNLVKTETDAYAIKDTTMGDLVNQLSKQNDILYGIKRDDKRKEILVVDLPGYGQFSVHTVENQCIAKSKVPDYPYKVYDVDIGKALLTQSSTPTMDYVLKKCKNKSEIMKALKELDEEEEAHQIIVKLGYNKNALAQIHPASNQAPKKNSHKGGEYTV